MVVSDIRYVAPRPGRFHFTERQFSKAYFMSSVRMFSQFGNSYGDYAVIWVG